MKKLALTIVLLLTVQYVLAQEDSIALQYNFYVADSFTNDHEVEIGLAGITNQFNHFTDSVMPGMIQEVKDSFDEKKLNGCDVDDSRFIYTLNLYFAKTVPDNAGGERILIASLPEVVKAELNLKQVCNGINHTLSDYKEEIIYAADNSGIGGYDVVKRYNYIQSPYIGGAVHAYNGVSATFLTTFFDNAKSCIVESVKKKFE